MLNLRTLKKAPSLKTLLNGQGLYRSFFRKQKNINLLTISNGKPKTEKHMHQRIQQLTSNFDIIEDVGSF